LRRALVKVVAASLTWPAASQSPQHHSATAATALTALESVSVRGTGCLASCITILGMCWQAGRAGRQHTRISSSRACGDTDICTQVIQRHRCGRISSTVAQHKVERGALQHLLQRGVL
jgi:protein-S-isoprenylcysteine O-methyltransferase Ste14